MARRGLVATAVFAAVLIAVIAFGWKLYQQSSCMNAGVGSSCPVLADVNGIQYSVSVGMDLINVGSALTPYGSVSQTNATEQFGDAAYSLAAFDPLVLLVAPASSNDEANTGGYRLLFALDRDHATVWPALCDFVPVERRSAPECGAPA